MKTPGEIKKGLKACGDGCCSACTYWDDCDYDDHHVALVTDALAYIRQLERKIPRWISVKAGLPRSYVDVDIVYGGSIDTIGYYSSVMDVWLDSNGNVIESVTHWKYRDKPPEETE